MGIAALHPLLGDCPERFGEIDFAPRCVGQFAFAYHRQQQQLGGRADRRCGANALHVLVHQADFIGRQRSISRLKLCNSRRAHQIGRVLNLLAAFYSPTEDLHHNFAAKHGRCRCPALHDRISQRP